MRFSTLATATTLAAAAAPAMAFDFSSYNPRCSLGTFYFSSTNECLPIGGIRNPPSPPAGSQCPALWYPTSKGCRPSYVTAPSQPSCPGSSIWNVSTWYCQAPATPTPSGNDCPSGHFWWSRRSCCLQHGGTPSPPLPPPGNSCPGPWYWHPGQGCCVPQHPDPPTPSCPSGYTWNPYTQCCKPDTPQPPQPQPSHKPRSNTETVEKRQHNAVPQHKKKAKRVLAQLSFCASGFTSCPIKGVFSSEAECIDTWSELGSCGGCTSVGEGQDCSKIANVAVSTCSSGACEIMSCKDGFTLSKDKKTCNPSL